MRLAVAFAILLLSVGVGRTPADPMTGTLKVTPSP
jgi:hypothetical protein